MSLIRKHFTVIFFIFASILYFALRFYNILNLPIFTDEAIYIRWAQIALNDPDWYFISLTDGKQPMFIWLAMFFLRFIDEPLLAARLVSVFSGYFSLIGLFFLTREVFKNKKVAYISSALYLFSPFALVYDRIALYDSLVAMFIIWSIYFEVLLIRRIKLVIAIILGLIIGAGMLTKTNADFALILFPFSALLFNYKIKNYKFKFFLWLVYALASAIIAISAYAILRLSPYYYIIGQKNNVFIYSFEEWLQHPFTSLLENLTLFNEWLVGYATIPFLILAFISLFITFKYTKEKILLLFWFLIPLISTALFGRLLYPRYLLFMVIPLIPLVAFSLYMLNKKIKSLLLKILILPVIFMLFIYIDYNIVFDFKNAHIPKADVSQFLTGWPSGVGVKETVEYLTKESANKKIFVGTQGTFGLMPYALEIYLHNNSNIEIKGFWPTNNDPPEEIIKKASVMPTYIIFYQYCVDCPHTGVAPTPWPVSKIFQIEKVEKNSFYTLYRVNK